MQQSKPRAFQYPMPLLGLFIALGSSSLSLEANEVLTLEQALNKCKNTYPSQFESKKRLACFDSISTPAIEVNAPESLTENPNASGTAATSGNASTGISVEKEKPVAIAVKKTNADLTYLERKWRLTSEGDWNINDFEIY